MKGTSKNFVSFIRSGLLLMAMVFAMAALPGFSTKAQAAEYPDYLSFTAVDGDVTIGMNKNGTPDDYVLEYSKNCLAWTSVTLTDTTEDIVTIPDGETYYFRTDREREGFAKNRYFYWKFLMTGEGKVEAGGNIMSLLDPTCKKTSVGKYAFYNLFHWCDKLMTAPKLPAQTLADYCYYGMFYTCTSLTEAPELPVQTLADHCYSSMFSGCVSLTKAPELPAQTLANNCYDSMFYSCSSLTEAPDLPAQTLAGYCYREMFTFCSSLTRAPELPAQTLANNCYDSMFYSCSSLTKAPELPAQTLANNCYRRMFTCCSSLTKAPELPAQTLKQQCYGSMFSSCRSLTKAPELPAQTLANNCYDSMFSGCSSLTKAPELPAQTLANNCYDSMFSGCSSLTEAPELPAKTLASSCYSGMFSGCNELSSVTVGFTEAETSLDDYLKNWLKGVSKTGTLVCPESLLQYTNEELGLPAGWVKKDVKEQIRQKINSFVTRMYQQCLSRNPDEAGLAGWVEQLMTGQMNGAQIAEAFVFSNEMLDKNLSDAEFLKVLYRSMMGREADEAGLKGWVSQLQGGYLSRSEVTEAFVESTEFTGICTEYGITRGDFEAVGPIERFVTRFYTICLGRPADQKGHWGWVKQLQQKNLNGAQIAEAFFFSDEFIGKNVSDEAYVDLLYRTIMGREPDEAGKSGWVNELKKGYITRKDMLKAFIESTEFTRLCAAYGIERGSL